MTQISITCYNYYMEEHQYIAIDLKSFYASVECVERGLDPLKAKLVVADESRTEKTICLAVSPELKKLGISGRARLFEVLQKIPREDFIVATPRMNKYIDVSRQIYNIYTTFVAPEDIHVYSIDEVFMDVTHYLKCYRTNAHDLALKIIRQVLSETGITATAGIGTNLYLAKIAMDIEAKHMSPDKDGVRIAELTERTYREKLWQHTPITDFWRLGRGYAKRLKKYGIMTMGDLAKYSLVGSDKLYKEFGINAELLIDHAWGYEPVTIKDIKNYRSDNHSLSSGQVLSSAYDAKAARVVVSEMADDLSLELAKKDLYADQIVLTIGYDSSNAQNYKGQITKDFYGRFVPKHAHGSINLGKFTASTTVIIKNTLTLFDKIIDKNLTVRRLNIVANHIKYDDREPNKQLDFFTDYQSEAKNQIRETNRQKAILEIKSKYGKNAILRGLNFEPGATGRARNNQVGGHRA